MSTIACIVEFLREWQTLIGSILGGLAGVVAAFIVALDARRRQERAAGYVILDVLTSAIVARENLDRIALESGVVPAEKPRWVVEKLMIARPKSSPLFAQSVPLVSVLDARLGAHLYLFSLSINGTEERLEKLEQARVIRLQSKVETLTPEQIRKFENLIEMDLTRAAGHAKCASHLMHYYVMSKITFWYRLARWFGRRRDLAICCRIIDNADDADILAFVAQRTSQN